MRLFVCSFLSADTQAFYGRHMADLIAAHSGMLRGIPPRSAHITYAFMARTDDRDLADIVQVVTGVVLRHDAIAIRLGEPMIQYARAEARLVYAPVITGERQLSHLTAEIVQALDARLGHDAVSGSRSAHVTLARFRRQTHRRAAAAFAEALTRSRVGTTTRADRVAYAQVVSSELSSAGAQYRIKASLPLRGASPAEDVIR